MSLSQHKKEVRNILFISAIGVYLIYSLLFASIPASNRNNFETFKISTQQTTASSTVIKFDKDYSYNFGIYGSQVQDHRNSYAIIIEIIYFKPSFFNNNYQRVANETTKLILEKYDMELNLRTATNIEKYEYFEIRVRLITSVHETNEYISVYGYVDNHSPVYLTDNGWFNFISFVTIFGIAFLIENLWNKYYLTGKIRELGYSDYNYAIDPRELLAKMANEKDKNLQDVVIRSNSKKEVKQIKEKAEKDFRMRK